MSGGGRRSRPRARRGVWTPWAQVLCLVCDYALQTPETRALYPNRKQRPDPEALVADEDKGGAPPAVCDECGVACWVRSDVALLQAIGYATDDCDDLCWHMEQTGGMCAALVAPVAGHEIVLTVDGDAISGGLYADVGEDDERWVDEIEGSTFTTPAEATAWLIATHARLLAAAPPNDEDAERARAVTP